MQIPFFTRGGRPHFFAISRLRARSKTERRSAKKNKREKSESAENERKKAVSRFFLPLPHHTGNPVTELISARQGEKQVLE
jgi:hypothetical protein